MANPQDPNGLRLVMIAVSALADCRSARGSTDDYEFAFAYYTIALDMAETNQNAEPNSLRDIYSSLMKLSSFLEKRQLPNDFEAALKHYRRALEISEKLFKDHPDIPVAFYDVTRSLRSTGKLLLNCGESSDVGEAWQLIERYIALETEWLATNSSDVAAHRHSLKELEELADAFARVPGSEATALEIQQHALEVALGLREINGDLYEHQRAAVFSFHRTFKLAILVNEEELAANCLGASYTFLNRMIQRGMELDPESQALHDVLKNGLSNAAK